MTDLHTAAKQALEALEAVTKEMLTLRDEIAERGGRPNTNVFHQRLWDSSFKAYTDSAIPTAEVLRQALANEALDKMAENARELGLDYEPAQQEPVKDNTYGYAKSLAEAIFKRHFASDEHYKSGRIVWGVNDTVIGILTQIDNMVADMVRRTEQPAQQEPFGHVTVRRLSQRFENHADQYHFYPAGQSPYLDNVDECYAVYTRPQAREWVGLTDEEIDELWESTASYYNTHDFARAIEAKLKEKNT